ILALSKAKDEDDIVCQLLQSLCELKQSVRVWNETIDSHHKSGARRPKPTYNVLTALSVPISTSARRYISSNECIQSQQLICSGRMTLTRISLHRKLGFVSARPTNPEAKATESKNTILAVPFDRGIPYLSRFLEHSGQKNRDAGTRE
ncbi:hypothetical protein GN958_ATG16877, partial [Phytophthora infestans]